MRWLVLFVFLFFFPIVSAAEFTEFSVDGSVDDFEVTSGTEVVVRASWSGSQGFLQLLADSSTIDSSIDFFNILYFLYS